MKYKNIYNKKFYKSHHKSLYDGYNDKLNADMAQEIFELKYMIDSSYDEYDFIDLICDFFVWLTWANVKSTLKKIIYYFR